MDEQKFGLTSDAALFTEYEVKTDDAIVLFKKFDEGRNDLTEELTVDAITKFVASNALPLVVEFNHETGKAFYIVKFRNRLLSQLEPPCKFEVVKGIFLTL